jgi:Flp pilus assembly secretin CpaC
MSNIKQFFTGSLKVACAAGLIAASAGIATADENDEPVRVTLDFAKIVKIDEPASTVIVGNSAIVEAAIEDDKTMVLTGQAPGSTNIIIMDADGNEIKNVRVVVASDTRDLTTVYAGTDRLSFACNPRCEQVAVIGDDQEAFAQALAQIFGRQSANGN